MNLGHYRFRRQVQGSVHDRAEVAKTNNQSGERSHQGDARHSLPRGDWPSLL